MADIDQDVAAIRSWSSKARPTSAADTAAINFVFDGSGFPLVAPMHTICKVGFPCKLLQVEILCDSPTGNAVFTLSHGTFADYPAATPIYPTATPLSLVAAPKIAIPALSTWIRRLHTVDFLYCTLVSVSGGITSLTLALSVRAFASGQGWGSRLLTDGSTNQLVNTAGDILGMRN